MTSDLFIVGKKGHGFVLVRLNPFRVAHVPDDKINKQYPKGDGYEAMAKGFAGFVVDQDTDPGTKTLDSLIPDLGKLLAKGIPASNADFCLVATVDSKEWSIRRKSFDGASGGLAGVGDECPPVPVVDVENPN